MSTRDFEREFALQCRYDEYGILPGNVEAICSGYLAWLAAQPGGVEYVESLRRKSDDGRNGHVETDGVREEI